MPRILILFHRPVSGFIITAPPALCTTRQPSPPLVFAAFSIFPVIAVAAVHEGHEHAVNETPATRAAAVLRPDLDFIIAPPPMR